MEAGPITCMSRLIAVRDSNFARKASRKDLGPENPFDDCYVISKTDERKLALGHCAILSNPSLERLEMESQRRARGYRG